MMPDLHPEELFDKASRGELSADEQRLLDAHLAQCAVCRFEHQVAEDFAAMPMPRLDVDRLVSNALLARTTTNLGSRPRRRVGPLLAVAVALGAMGSFAAVGQWTGVLPRLITAITAPAAPRAPTAPARVGVRPSPAGAPVAEVGVTPPPAVEVLPPPPPQPPAEPLERLEPQPVKAPAHLAAVAPARRPAGPVTVTLAATGAVSPQAVVRPSPSPGPAPEPVRPAVDVAASTPLVPEPPSATVLFATANQARLAGDRAWAMAKYAQVLTSWPASAEAHQTQAILGRLLLDQGAPSSALDHLEAYLRGPDTALREEVLSARAQALMRLGRTDDEAKAWRELLDGYPTSVHGTRARARLEALAALP